MRFHYLGIGLVCAFALAGCAFETDEETASATVSAVHGGAQGTALYLDAWATNGQCDGSDVLVHRHVVLTSTGSVGSVILSVNGKYVMTVEPQDFTHHGRVKTWEFHDVVKDTPGSYSLKLCATQSGAQGRKSKEVCTVLKYDAVCLPPARFKDL